jgi:hypothetical protein
MGKVRDFEQSASVRRKGMAKDICTELEVNTILSLVARVQFLTASD